MKITNRRAYIDKLRGKKTMGAFADSLDLHRDSLYRWVNGKYEYSQGVVDALKKFGLTVEFHAKAK